ncbi:uncharacterized protein [Montipora foliosa]|uniref:uncharacterized protein n=1 Tax=Montipora foliosa TaxID=591990 RepID=UPI0035F1B9AC
MKQVYRKTPEPMTEVIVLKRAATLLKVIGNDAIDVFNTITWDAEGDDTKIEKVLQKFEEHCEPKKNASYERYKFFSRAQESGETIDQYVTVLRKWSEICEFGTLRNSLIKDRIVLGVSNCKARERLLIVQERTLEKALDVVRSAEMTEKQLQELESDSSLHGIGKEKSKSVLKKQLSDKEEKPPPNKTFNCRNCGTRHGARECPANEKTCRNCQKQKHFQNMCKVSCEVFGRIVQPSSKVTTPSAEEDSNETTLHGIAFASLVSYLEEFRDCENVAVFKLVALAKLYSAKLEELGITSSSKINTTRLRERLLGAFPDLSAHTQGRDVLHIFNHAIGDAIRKACEQDYILQERLRLCIEIFSK